MNLTTIQENKIPYCHTHNKNKIMPGIHCNNKKCQNHSQCQFYNRAILIDRTIPILTNITGYKLIGGKK